MTVTIYHNPRCSKSRQALKLLEDRELEVKIVRYLKEPPTVEDLSRLLDLLGMEPRDLIRRKQKEYKALGLDREDLSRQELIEAMVEHPILIERPIVVADGKAALGRPPEHVLDIL